MLSKVKSLIVVLVVAVCLPLSAMAAGGGVVNINTATKVELQSVKGIGPKMAEKIVKYRELHGKFKQVDDLCNIHGIGDKTVARMSSQICVK